MRALRDFLLAPPGAASLEHPASGALAGVGRREASGRRSSPAVAAAPGAVAVAGNVPVVLVLGGPRPAAFDALLAEQDRLVVLTRPGADAAIGALALAGLPAAGPSCAAATVALGPGTRALAAAGFAVPAALRRALDAAMDDGE
jgi:hypothetical protein